MNTPPIAQGQNNIRSSGQDILLPPNAKDRKRRQLLVEVNSRDRNVGIYPNPSQFRWRFQRPLKDVVSIQIVGGTVPTRMFNITNTWNTFTFREGTALFTISLNIGRYSLDLLATELASQLNRTPGITNNYSVGVSPTTDQIVVTRDSGLLPFAFLFATGNFVDLIDSTNVLLQMKTPRRILGFLFQDYTDGGTGKITSPLAMDLEFLLNRIYLFMNHDNSQDLGTIERSVGKGNPHSIIYMDASEYTYKTFNKDLFQPLFVSKPAPIARMTTLDIALRDEFDNLIQFGGRDFTLLLEIEYLE
jgi:hypothetical protein